MKRSGIFLAAKIVDEIDKIAPSVPTRQKTTSFFYVQSMHLRSWRTSVGD